MITALIIWITYQLSKKEDSKVKQVLKFIQKKIQGLRQSC